MLDIEKNNESSTAINWFPGHMAKARRELKEDLKLVDLVAEVVDARIPISSRNPDLPSICEGKPRIVVLNKTDLVEKNLIKYWVDFYSKNNILCVPFSIKDRQSKNLFRNKVLELMKEKLDSWKSKGIINRKIRIMIVGIPNVGKSAFINTFAGNSKAKVENKPGVTRKNQWFSAGNELEFLDTPGVLWPKFNDKEIAYNLAFTGAIKQSILDIEELAIYFIEKIKNFYPEQLKNRYKVDISLIKDIDNYEILNLIGKKRGFLISGGEIDTLRTSEMLLEEFRSGKLGKILLEYPENIELRN